jgi:hypothetical protein
MMFSMAAAFAANIVAVLEIIPNNENVNLEVSEFRHLTDELRMRARETLPSSYSVLTRDNIMQLLPPDEEEAECFAQGYAVDIGRAIGAEYVTQGFVGNFAEMLTLTVELYESMNGNMLGSFVTESENAKGLLMTIREKAPGLFNRISTHSLPTAAMKSNTPFFVAIGLDILGAAAIGFGIYKHADSNKLYDDYKKKPTASFENPEQFEAFESAKSR